MIYWNKLKKYLHQKSLSEFQKYCANPNCTRKSTTYALYRWVRKHTTNEESRDKVAHHIGYKVALKGCQLPTVDWKKMNRKMLSWGFHFLWAIDLSFISPPKATFRMLILDSIGCALAMKIGGEAKAHEIPKAQKSFGEIPPG